MWKYSGGDVEIDLRTKEDDRRGGGADIVCTMLDANRLRKSRELTRDRTLAICPFDSAGDN